MSEERRESTRHQVPTVLLKVETEDKMRHRFLRDLSEGGMFVQTTRPVPAGSEIDVHLVAPHSDEPIILRGTVIRVDKANAESPGGMGVQFEPNDEPTQTALRTVLARYGEPLSPEPASPKPKSSDIELEKMRERLRCADSQIVALYNEIEQLEEDDAFQKQLVERVLNENKKLNAKRTELKGHVEQLAADNAKLKAIISQISQEGEAAKRDFWELSADLAEVVAREEQRTQEAADHSEKATAALSTERQRNQELSARVAELEAVGKSAQAKSAQLEKIAGDTQSRVAAAEKFGHDAQARAAALEKKLAGAQQKLAGEHQDWRERARAAEAAANAAQSSLAAWQEHHENLQARNDKLAARLQRLRTSERHLRRMLSLVAGESNGVEGDTISPEALAELQTRTGYEFDYDPGDDIDEMLFSVEGESILPGGVERPTENGNPATQNEAPLAAAGREEGTNPGYDENLDGLDLGSDDDIDLNIDGLDADIDVDIDDEADDEGGVNVEIGDEDRDLELAGEDETDDESGVDVEIGDEDRDLELTGEDEADDESGVDVEIGGGEDDPDVANEKLGEDLDVDLDLDEESAGDTAWPGDEAPTVEEHLPGASGETAFESDPSSPYSEFVQRLRQGATLALTPEFRAVSMVDRDEVVFSCVIERATKWERIVELAKQRFDEDRLADLLDVFFERGQIVLTD